MATTDGATAVVTASQFGLLEVEFLTGASSVDCADEPTLASDDGSPASNAPVAAAVPRLARTAAMTAALATGTHTDRSRFVAVPPPGPCCVDVWPRAYGLPGPWPYGWPCCGCWPCGRCACEYCCPCGCWDCGM